MTAKTSLKKTIAVLAILIVSFTTRANQVQEKRGLGQIIEMVNSIPDLITSDKTDLIFALQDKFGDSLFNTSIKPEYLKSMKHMIIAGLFEEAEKDDIIDMVMAVYYAENHGAPINIVEELAVPGFSKPITWEQLEVYSKSMERLSNKNIDPSISEELISYALIKNWSPEIVSALTGGLIQGNKSGVNLQKLLFAFIIQIDQGIANSELSSMVKDEINLLKEQAERKKDILDKRVLAYTKMQGAISKGIPEKVAQELYLYAIEGDWKKSVIQSVFEGMVEGHKLNLTPEKTAIAFIVRIEQGVGEISPSQMVKEEIIAVKEVEKERLALIEKDLLAKQALSTSKGDVYQSALQRGKDIPSDYQELKKSRTSLNVNLMSLTINNLLGVPYRWGGTTRYGFDCSGFVQYLYKEQGVRLPRVSRQQYRVGKSVSMDQLQYGDLVFFSKYGDGYITHVGMYIGNNRFVHSCGSKGVTITDFNKYYYKKRYVGAKRLV